MGRIIHGVDKDEVKSGQGSGNDKIKTPLAGRLGLEGRN
jgi:hypothetical protein